MPPEILPSRLVIALVMAVGVVASASAPILIKVTPLPPLQLAAGRLLLAAILLAPAGVVAARGFPEFGMLRWLRSAWAPGVLVGMNFATWNTGVKMSPTADAALIGNLVPLVLPFLLAAIASERVTLREAVATLVSLTGLALRWHTNSPTIGHLMCLLAMALYAAYLALGRRNRSLPSVWPYIALVYTIGGVVCALLALVIEPRTLPTRQAWIGVAAMAAFPTILGHSIANWSIRHLRGQVVSLWYLLAPPLTGIFAWLAWSEPPGPGWTVAFVGVVLGLIVLAVPWPASTVPHPADRSGAAR